MPAVPHWFKWWSIGSFCGYSALLVTLHVLEKQHAITTSTKNVTLALVCLVMAGFWTRLSILHWRDGETRWGYVVPTAIYAALALAPFIGLLALFGTTILLVAVAFRSGGQRVDDRGAE